MGMSQVLMRIRAWWFLRIAKGAAVPPDVGQYLLDIQDRNQRALDEIERSRQKIIEKGAADGKTISTEAALRYVVECKETYDGPDRDLYVAEMDRFIEDFRRKHGPEIPVADAYAILKELELRFGRGEEVKTDSQSARRQLPARAAYLRYRQLRILPVWRLPE